VKSRSFPSRGSSLNLGHLFNPETFLNALRQQTARRRNMPMDEMKLATTWDLQLLGDAAADALQVCVAVSGAPTCPCSRSCLVKLYPCNRRTRTRWTDVLGTSKVFRRCKRSSVFCSLEESITTGPRYAWESSLGVFGFCPFRETVILSLSSQSLLLSTDPV
jgi:hypothetical protein